MHGLIEKYLKEYLEANKGKTLREPEADAFFETEMEVDANVDAETEADSSFEQEMETDASFATDMEVDATVDDPETEVDASMEPEMEVDAFSDKEESEVDDRVLTEREVRYIAARNKVSKIDKPEVDKSDETETEVHQKSKGFDEKLDDSVNSVQTEEKAGEFKCEYCSSEFTHEDQLKKHLGKEHFGIAPFECDTCNATFFGKNVLKHHMTNFHGISSNQEKRNLYNCDICNLGFNQVEEMRTHVSSVHEWKKYSLQCGLCDKIFTDQKTLKTHCIEVHGEEKSFKCTVCTKKFSFEKNLKLHIAHHDRNKQQKCDKCNETLPNLEKLREHMVKVHFFDCNQCKFMQIFPTKEALKTHIENVHEEKNQFPSKEALKTHNENIHVHEGKNQFQCAICKRSFVLLTDLNKHILEFHKGTLNLGNGIQLSSLKEKNNEFQKQSNETKSNKENMDPGKKSWSKKLKKGNKRFECQFCQKDFAHKPSLLRHIKTVHEGENPNFCELCNKDFVCKTDLETHNKLYHKDHEKTTETEVETETEVDASMETEMEADAYDIGETDVSNVSPPTEQKKNHIPLEFTFDDL